MRAEFEVQTGCQHIQIQPRSRHLEESRALPEWNLESIPTSSAPLLPQLGQQLCFPASKGAVLFDESSTMDQTALIPQHHILFKNGKTLSQSLC
jgi:hypothetical protein